MTTTMLRHRMENRWNSLKYLDDDSKIELIMMLSQSLKSPHKEEVISASRFYGIWGDDGMSAEDFVDMLKAERSFNQGIVEL